MNSFNRVAVLFAMLLGLTVQSDDGLPADLRAAMESGQGTGRCRIAAHLPQDGDIALRAGKYTVTLKAASGYTIGEVFYDGKRLATESGAQGTVILTEQAKESTRNPDFEGDPWIGTGHGGDVVHDVTCTVDDEPTAFPREGEITGQRIVIEKTHTLYKFAGRVRLILTADGYEEYQELRATEAFADLHYLYFFMHPWMPTTATYLAKFPDGEETGGEFGEQRQVSLHQQYKRQPRWFALHDPELELGILQIARDPIPGSSLVQVRERYHKHYTVLPVRGRQFQPGDTIAYAVFVTVLPTETGDWTASRAAAARLIETWPVDRD